MSGSDDDSRTARQIARSQRRRAGDRSASLANKLMKLPDAAVDRLDLDEDLRDAIARARAVTSHVARRRAERTLAGELRRFGLGELEAQLENLREASHADARELHLAEQWRARLIEEGIAAASTFPGGADPELARLVDAAQRERATGRPPGAARALFRHVMQRLKARQQQP
jgi:ribosome-associated protein